METLPRSHVHFNLENLSIEEAYKELNKCVYYPEDTNWDGAYYWIKKKENLYTTYCEMYMFTSPEEKEREDADAVECDLRIPEPMQIIFSFIQDYYLRENPNCPFDSLFITVQKDGRYVKNFEYNDEEVEPNVPPIPKQITADYLLQNLYGCLTANAPENYVWAWEVLTRRMKEGKTAFGAAFYYSIHEDMSEPMYLKPGENIYMINVSDRLFKEFLLEETKNWSKIIIKFKSNGKASIIVEEKNYSE